MLGFVVVAALFEGAGQQQEWFGHPLLVGDVLLLQAAGRRIEALQEGVEMPFELLPPVEVPPVRHQRDGDRDENDQDDAEDRIVITGEKTVHRASFVFS